MELPAAWSGRFDLIHQRLLVAGLSPKDWPIALAEMYRVLAPGGWMQLGEISRWRAGPVTERHWNMVSVLHEVKSGYLRIADALPDLVAQAGFVDVTMKRLRVPMSAAAGEHANEARRNFKAVFSSMKTAVMKAGGLGVAASPEDYDAFMDSLEAEWRGTEDAHHGFIIVCARRPE